MKMESIFTKLNDAIKTNNEQDIINNLKLILQQETESDINIDIINSLLKNESKNVQTLTSEVIAELAKKDNNRKILTNENVINKLMSFLQNKDNSLIFTTIRALGNICYENEDACNFIGKIGVDYILTVLKNDSERKDNTLTTKASGLLVNLLSTNENLARTTLKCGILLTLEELLVKYKTNLEENVMLLTFLLSVLNNLCDYLDEQNINFPESLAYALLDIFKKSENPELCVMCLEIFYGQSEKDEIKSLLAKEGVCELLYELIEKYRHKVIDEDSQSVLKMACDLLVIILTGDYCMQLLYDNGKSKTYKNMLIWLDSEDSDLLSTGILALGNFARKDTHCIQMVKNGVSKKLIQLLSKYNTSTNISDVKIQHALLSTMKNLVIPKENKAQVLEENLIDVIYPMIKIDQYIVVFKLLGTFRMVIDGQEKAALDLISRVDFIECLVYWCYNSDHLGVRGEVPRLLCWLIKHCHSFKPFDNFLSVNDSVKCIVEMISSNHAVMQNEAFCALSLLCLGVQENHDKSKQNFFNNIIQADIGKNLNFVINKYGEKWDVATVENLLTLLDMLVKNVDVVAHLKLSNINEEVLNKLSKHSNAKLIGILMAFK